MAQRFAALAILTLLAAAVAGCSSSGDGSASVYVKDAPTDEFDEIHVVFTKVEVHASGSGGDDGNSTAGWRTLVTSSSGIHVDLLNASGTQAAFLGEANLTAGKYTQIRVTVKEAFGVQNGTRVAITLSSDSLKLNHPFDVDAGKETRIVLDFDLDGSLHQQGGGAWRMTPVVGSVSAETVDDEESGSEAGESPGDVEDVG